MPLKPLPFPLLSPSSEAHTDSIAIGVAASARCALPFNSSIGLNPSPQLEVSAAIGSKDIAIGGEVGFDTSSSSFTKYNAGISFNKQDFSAAVLLIDKGQTVKASYGHVVNPLMGTEVTAEMTHRLSNFQNSFSLGSVHKIDSLTSMKTRFSDDGKIAISSQREWRPKSLVTFSAEYDTKAINTALLSSPDF
ncbi:mitochondrial outer membrane protein porin 4-like [Salvia hispanica]|uniref:mitochondrial outer membrane protein porin 4-like n=1 Tax=Salvia hispanica TaxID=49212 RepID=UPI002009B59A|nr:mitochondrial outer membrane protein porin 4-like [Salvia hispanica]